MSCVLEFLNLNCICEECLEVNRVSVTGRALLYVFGVYFQCAYSCMFFLPVEQSGPEVVKAGGARLNALLSEVFGYTAINCGFLHLTRPQPKVKLCKKLHTVILALKVLSHIFFRFTSLTEKVSGRCILNMYLKLMKINVNLLMIGLNVVAM